jgi:hypothetical protein
MHKVNLQRKTNRSYLDMKPKKNKLSYVKIVKKDESEFLKKIEQFVIEQIVQQAPFDWISWIPAGRSREYYHNLLIKDKAHFVQAYAKRSQEGYINVYLIFGEGFNFDLVDFEKIKEKRKLCFDEKLIIHRFYNNILSLPTWNYVKNDWRNECLSKFSYKGRYIAPHPYWKVEKFIPHS